MFGTKVYTDNNTQNYTNLQKRKSREGDWICINCSNYNYAFRVVCKFLINTEGNRCKGQTKE